MPDVHEINDVGQPDNVQIVTTEVRDAGVTGLFAAPLGAGPFPSVVAFGGSGGGLGPTVGWAPALAARGFAVLAIAPSALGPQAAGAGRHRGRR